MPYVKNNKSTLYTSGRQLKEDKPAMSWLNFLEGLLGTAKKSYGKDDSIFQLPILLEK